MRLDGQYFTPSEIHAQFAQEAAQERAGRRQALTAVRDQGEAQEGPDGPRPPGVRDFTPHPASESPKAAQERQRLAANRRRNEILDALAIGVDPETGEVGSLPCRSLGTTQPRSSRSGSPKSLSGAHKKTAQALSWNVAELGRKYGANNLGFFTLTFGDHVLCAKEASRRFNSLATHVLKVRFGEYIRVLERQKHGRIHYHLLVVLDEDIRTGFNFAEAAEKIYTSASPRLRREWAWWRKNAKTYGFGRCELQPVKSNSDALAQYVGKYIGKHFNSRIEEDKGVRLVSYSRGARMATSRFTRTGTTHADEWRRKLYTFALQLNAVAAARQGNKYGHLRINSMQDLTRVLGKNWSFHWRDYICGLPPAELAVPF